MNKNRMILAVAGGVIGLAVLVTAYLTWSSWSAKTAALEGDDENEGLEAVVAKAEKLSRSPVYPCAESVKATEENAAKLAEWMSGARRVAAAGDRVFAATTPPAFKTFLVQDAKRLVSLPGSVAGALAKPDFAFGPFKGYIAGGDLPSEAQLSELQRRWDDVSVVTETLAACGIGELTDVQFAAAEKKADEAEQQNARGSRRQQKKPTKKSKAKADDESGAKSVSSFSYVFAFTAKPPAFVKAVNALETCERFISVDDFSFRREKDAIAEAFGADEKKEAAQTGGRRRRRGGAPTPAAGEKADEAKSGIVTDPQMDAPLAVTMTVTVHDFRSLEDGDKNQGNEKGGETK